MSCFFRLPLVLVCVSVMGLSAPILGDTEPAPRPQLAHPETTQVVSLNGEWLFTQDASDAGESMGLHEAAYSDATWTPVAVPHTWNLNGRLATYRGVVWYRRHFELPAEFEGLRLALRFEAVAHSATVWLNDKQIGWHEGGYTPFSFDVTPTVRPGADNVLVVRVDNAPRADSLPAKGNRVNADYYDAWYWGGITGRVAIEATGDVAIVRTCIRAEPDLSSLHRQSAGGGDALQTDSAIVDVAATVQNTGRQKFTGRLVLRVLDAEGKEAILTEAENPELTQKVSVATGTSEVRCAFALPQPRLWHFRSAELYVLETAIEDEQGQPCHVARTTFGVRKIELRSGRLYVNGEWVRLVGVARHADSPETGPVERYAIVGRDLDDLRRANAVLTRPGNSPAAASVLDCADRNGLLVISELPAWQLKADQLGQPKVKELAARMLTELIRRDANHPSLWAWSLGEGCEWGSAEGQTFIRDLSSLVRRSDPTRFVTVGISEAQPAAVGEVGDFVMWTPPLARWNERARLGPALNKLHELWPDRMVLVGKWGGYDEDTPAELYRAKLARIIATQMAEMAERPFVGGAIFWTYRYYKTPIAWKDGYKAPEATARAGLVGRDGKPLPAFDVVRDAFAPVRIASIAHVLSAADKVTTHVRVSANSPVSRSLPSHTLPDCIFEWLTGPKGDTVQVVGSLDDKGSVRVPLLKPGYFSPGAQDVAWLKFDWPLAKSPSQGVMTRVVQSNGQVWMERASELALAALPKLSGSAVTLLDLAGQFNRDGISTEENTKDGNMDAPGKPNGASYPKNELPAAHSLLTLKGKPMMAFLFPDGQDGKLNNIACAGQTVHVPPAAYVELWVLGAATYGAQTSDLELRYEDGSEAEPLELSDWCETPGFGERQAVVAKHRHGWKGEEEEMTCGLWAQRVPVDAKRKLTALVLPQNPKMHIFALSLMTP